MSSGANFIIKDWRVPSESSPGVTYVVSLDGDGKYSCSCKGWTLHTPRRACKHIRQVESGSVAPMDPLCRAMEKAEKRAVRYGFTPMPLPV